MRAIKALFPARTKNAVKTFLRNRAQSFLNARPKPLRHAILNLWLEYKISRIVRASAPLFRALHDQRDLKVQLGPGYELKPGWINIDLVAHSKTLPPDTILILHDLRQGLPLGDGSCAYIYSSHFLEHLEYEQGVHLLQDCYRVLKPGGVFRAAMPNFKRMFAAYLQRDQSYFDLIDIPTRMPYIEPGTETIVDHVNYGVYQLGEHKCVYDEEKLEVLLRHTGFSSVTVVDYQEGIDSSHPVRLKYTFYIEAIK